MEFRNTPNSAVDSEHPFERQGCIWSDLRSKSCSTRICVLGSGLVPLFRAEAPEAIGTRDSVRDQRMCHGRAAATLFLECLAGSGMRYRENESLLDDVLATL